MSQKVFLIAPARSGAGLFDVLLRLDPIWTDSKLSNPSKMTELAGIERIDSDIKKSDYSHVLLDVDVPRTLAQEESSKDKTTIELAYNPRFGLQVGFLAKAFPSAKFIYVARSPLATVASAGPAWSSGRFVTEPNLEGWWGEKWSFGLIPGWSELIGKPLPEVAARQWATTSELALDALEKLPKERWTSASFEALLKEPTAEIKRVVEHLGLKWNATVPSDLPASPNTLNPKNLKKKKSRPNPEVLTALGQVSETVNRVNQLRAPITPKEESSPNDESNLPASRRKKQSVPSSGTPFANVHTESFRALLAQAKSSIFITTYKTGHVINIRQDEKGLNSEFLRMKKPMGMAFSGKQLAIGLEQSIKTWVNLPTLRNVVEPKGKNQAIYIPRHETFTGDVAIHEMAFGTAEGYEGLWWVNTKFSCLCKQDMDFSWKPVWRPEWITEFAAEDRCHVNGLAMVDGRPKYVSALSQTNEPNGWRKLKGTSGVIVDIETNKIVAQGLSMPHSPRWYQGKLWVLESGKGSIASVNIETGEVTTVATLPGFTRGLSFIGKYAIIGLSQVRESVFKELPVTEQTAERACGVWIVDIETGKIAGSMKFQGAIQEIFDVKLLPSAPWATILEPDQVTALAYHLPEEVLKNLIAGKKRV